MLCLTDLMLLTHRSTVQLPCSQIDSYFRFVGVVDPRVIADGAAYARVTALGALPLSAAACASAGFKGIGEIRPALVIAAVTVLCVIGTRPRTSWLLLCLAVTYCALLPRTLLLA